MTRGMCICCDRFGDDMEIVDRLDGTMPIFECSNCRGSWKWSGRVLLGVGVIITYFLI